MRPSHRHEKEWARGSVEPKEIPGRIERRRRGCPACAGPRCLLSCAGDCRNRLRVQIDRTHQVILGIGYEERRCRLVERKALRSIEPRMAERPVMRSGLTAAYDVEYFTGGRCDDDAIVVRVRDEQAARWRVRGNLAREPQFALGVVHALERQGNRIAVQLPAFVEHHQHGCDRLVEGVGLSLSGRCGDNVTCRVDQDECRPGTRAIGAPDLEVGVIGDGMLDTVANDDAADVLGLTLVRELGGMNSNDDQFVAILLLQTSKVRKDVYAVDAAVRPEIQEDDLALQIGLQTERLRDVQPADGPGQLRSVDGLVTGQSRRDACRPGCRSVRSRSPAMSRRAPPPSWSSRSRATARP